MRDFLRFRFLNGSGSYWDDVHVYGHKRDIPLTEFVYRADGPLASFGYRRAVAPRRMQDTGDYLADVGFRRDGEDMVRELI